MRVEIWSDVMCPFCFIGKRKFEMALEKFGSELEISWKSFQLDPGLQANGKSVTEFLAERKGWSLDQARAANEHVSAVAKEVGLEFNFDRAVVANSFDAHRFSHLAKSKGLQNEAEEVLFKAYFTEGLNTADHGVLAELGKRIGMDAEEIKTVLAGDDFAEDVRHDIYESNQIGVRGVPFFLFNDKYSVTGAQAPEYFLEALNHIHSELLKG